VPRPSAQEATLAQLRRELQARQEEVEALEQAAASDGSDLRAPRGDPFPLIRQGIPGGVRWGVSPSIGDPFPLIRGSALRNHVAASTQPQLGPSRPYGGRGAWARGLAGGWVWVWVGV